MLSKIKVYTDGACQGNTGKSPGGWGVVIIRQDSTYETLFDGEAATTNNRMELLAAIEGLRYCKVKYSGWPIEIYTDSEYVKKGITEWVSGWKRRGWCKSDGDPVKNDDLWKVLDELNQSLQVAWHWVRGHNGDVWNERADQLARHGVNKALGRDPSPTERPPRPAASDDRRPGIEQLAERYAKGLEVSDGQLTRLKVGRDSFSSMKLETLREACPTGQVDELEIAGLGEGLQVVALRWVLRGLPPVLAARKAVLADRFANDARAKAYREKRREAPF